jgi:hypothetical protein
MTQLDGLDGLAIAMGIAGAGLGLVIAGVALHRS